MAGSSRSTVTMAAVRPISIGVRTDSVIAPSYPDHAGAVGRYATQQMSDQLIPGPNGKALPPSQAHLGQSSRSPTSYVLFDRARDQRATRCVCWGSRLAMPGVASERWNFRRAAG